MQTQLTKSKQTNRHCVWLWDITNKKKILGSTGDHVVNKNKHLGKHGTKLPHNADVSYVLFWMDLFV